MDGTTSPPDMDARCQDYRRIETAIRFIDDHRLDQPTLDEIAAAVNISPYHFQRLFTRWAGVSPKRFLSFLTLAHARAVLEDSGSVLDAALDSGLSGPGRLHDLFVTFDAVTPGDVGRGGGGLTIRHGFHSSPFGRCLVAVTGRGVCALLFVDGDGDDAAVDDIRRRWPAAQLIADAAATTPMAEAVFAAPGGAAGSVPLVAAGTNFQIKVWEAVIRVPPGHLVSYGRLAQAVGRPRSARAVGNALGRNPLAFLIPCHRVIRRTGAFDGYRWGEARRQAILGWEAARAAAE